MARLINCEGLVASESVRLSSNQAEKTPPECTATWRLKLQNGGLA